MPSTNDYLNAANNAGNQSAGDVAERVGDLNLATLRLHPLKSDLRFWSLTVRANWRIIFRFEDGRASDVDLVDYH